MPHFSTRTINISSDNLGEGATLLLIFDEQPMQGIYHDYFPVAWQVRHFPAAGHHRISMKYNNQLVLSHAQTESNVIVSGIWCSIDPGQEIDLIEDPTTGRIIFTEPRHGVEKYIKANNKSQDLHDIGIGFVNGGSPTPTLLLYEDIHPTQNVTTQFLPILKAYITERYREHEVIRQPIRTVPSIWKQDLADLPETSNWKLQCDPASGRYSITEA